MTSSVPTATARSRMNSLLYDDEDGVDFETSLGTPTLLPANVNKKRKGTDPPAGGSCPPPYVQRSSGSTQISGLSPAADVFARGLEDLSLNNEHVKSAIASEARGLVRAGNVYGYQRDLTRLLLQATEHSLVLSSCLEEMSQELSRVTDENNSLKRKLAEESAAHQKDKESADGTISDLRARLTEIEKSLAAVEQQLAQSEENRASQLKAAKE